HFTTSDYTNALKKRLKNGAVPSVKETVQEASNSTSEGQVSALQKHLKNCFATTVKESMEEASNSTFDVDVTAHCSKTYNNFGNMEATIIEETTNQSSCNNDHNYAKAICSTVEYIEHKDDIQHNQYNEDENHTIARIIKDERKVKVVLCCMQQCYNTSKEHSMFHFPKIFKTIGSHQQIDDDNLQRFIKWVIACGISQVLFLDPNKVQSKYYICDSHFHDDSFTSSDKNRLKSNAVPTENNFSLTSNALIEEYTQNIQKWIDSSFEQFDFFTKEACAFAFEEDMASLTWRICHQCNEKTMVSNLNKIHHLNKKCQHSPSECWKYSAENDMDPGEQPEELKGLTFIEEQVIARVHPIITVFKVKGHQYAYKGNVISFSQDVQEIANQLPHRVKDLNSVISIRFEQSSGTYHDFHIRQGRVRNALMWLKANNPLYSHIEISEENLQMLPQDGNVTDEILSVSMDNVSNNECSDDVLDEGDNIHQSGLPYNIILNQDDAVKKCLKWPNICNEPINEKNTPGFIPCAFPTLYP
ncbi:putative transcriptional regulator SLK1, partial [Frankliniella fusca]